MADREKTDATPEDKKNDLDPGTLTDEELEQVSGGGIHPAPCIQGTMNHE